jgi:anti-sigma B factor antagonist
MQTPLSDGRDQAPFHCEVEPRRDMVRVHPVGEVDLATAPEIEAQLRDLDAAGFKRLVLDLTDVSFLDSTGLRVILAWDARSRADGLSFSLVPGPPTVQRLFELTGVTERLTFVDG